MIISRTESASVWLAGLFLAFLPGCSASERRLDEKVAELHQEVMNERALQEAQRGEIAELRKGMRRALCRPDLGQLVNELIKECGNDVCPGTKVQTALNDISPGHKKSLLRFMGSLNHVVFYLNTGVTEVHTVRKQALSALLQDSLLGTNYLLVVQPATGLAPRSRAREEALVRAKVIIDKLRERYVEEKRIRLWIYEVPIRDGEISEPEDRPRFSEPKDLSRGAWLFRIDC
jgi:hypothetical protein